MSLMMDRLLPLALLTCTLVNSGPANAAEPDPDQIAQVSVINALMLGQFDGTLPLGELLKLGDFGLGTFDHLDGELIALDGKIYQARSDGTVHECGPEMTTPFAVVTPFNRDVTVPCPPVGSLEQLEQVLATLLPQENVFVAIRVDAKFASISLRAVGRQEPPYRPLTEVVAHQSEWTRENLNGTLVGIRCPKWVTGISVPGYHWHFLSADHKVGGHVFDCRIESGTISFDRCKTWVVKLNDSLGAGGKDLSQDLSKELNKVERQRGTTEK
ncbi:acetolactate decarboxylase [Planctomicrobium piriforme]|uniref:Alpha-acetolactate decarboxylase n=1 Tax=Planctomicrobium piriforme TaxID=1576369 RepID=A0A1I3RRG7_9PLAN|nr:acetolactate decarboxylase [Planctomicrobium piriforme]SFJ47881.1 acetolactate decarboxylase [Planctomicrobium piriforme]